MFSTDDPTALHQILDPFPIPMFAAERGSAAAHFRLICVNTAYTQITALTTADVAGKRPAEILPDGEGRIVENRFASCIEKQEVSRFHEALHINGRRTRWETTIVPIRTAGGHDRVIGTALSLSPIRPIDSIPDAEFYACLAQMQLGHVHGFLERLEFEPVLPEDIRNQTMMVAGLTRSMSQLLNDLRRATAATHRAEAPDRQVLRAVV